MASRARSVRDDPVSALELNQIPRFKMNYRSFWITLGIVLLLRPPAEAAGRQTRVANPNVLVIIADQWRFEAFGFAGNRDVKTPNLDRMAGQGIRFVNAVSTCPVCSPMRASFLTGQRPLTHGVFLNDVPLNPSAPTIAKVFAKNGYDTGWIGKWHLNGDGRSAFIPRDRRQGFDYWKVLECTHEYNHSKYFGDTDEPLQWEGYDAIAQTHDAEEYLRSPARTNRPFFLVLAWGPPHDPYFTAPEKYRRLYNSSKLILRPNVPDGESDNTRKNLAGYYAHCTALDNCIGELRHTLEETGLSTNTVVIFTSDHGDMLGSQGLAKKQKPYDESIRVPLVLTLPGRLARASQVIDAPIASEDLMPTILGLCGITAPATVEGLDFSRHLRGGRAPGDGASLITCVAPFGEWDRRHGGREFRGLRTSRHTYVRDRSGPWLLFDNLSDPFQTNNLAGKNIAIEKTLQKTLARKLEAQKDKFLGGDSYVRQWGYQVDANGTVPYAR